MNVLLEAGKFYLVTFPDQNNTELLEVLATNIKTPGQSYDDMDSVGIAWTRIRGKYIDWRMVSWKSDDNTMYDGEIEVHKEVNPPRHRQKLRQLLLGQRTEYKKG